MLNLHMWPREQKTEHNSDTFPQTQTIQIQPKVNERLNLKGKILEMKRPRVDSAWNKTDSPGIQTSLPQQTSQNGIQRETKHVSASAYSAD